MQRLPKSTCAVLAYANSGALEMLSVTVNKVNDAYGHPMFTELSRDTPQ